ncbi:hypoxanthine phosphoribosyltransferase [Prolixibacter sp. NT017]|uniref:hypoxanthine phosphoribosyltransferase n=1 Tax=Prolixibacter sp. NT017 TaxID=2652390 RepID=UPI00127C83FD|nr:hypoxanthine phosphoribosyltransferase [Prolixibacter sp. NT017]GET27689.1 hypoxanthine phosphoribosyltransferase [Prolixibacter sp. NT017]
MKRIKLWDKEFEISIPEGKIQEAIQKMADQMKSELEGKEVIFLCILNGSFIFSADLMKKLELLDAQITFLKLASYSGTQSTGNLKELIGLNEDLQGRNVVILEDIVDSGFTITDVVRQVKEKGAADVKVATLLFKPDALKTEAKLDYVGLEIPNDFIVGYGLDYDGRGRNLKDIYTLVPD